jgi:hypothetical protein
MISSVTEFMDKIASALESDEILTVWCNAKFGKAPIIYIGHNEENPPVAANYPIIVIFYAERARGEDTSRIIYACELGFGVYSEEIKVSGNVREYEGLRLVENFREYGENAILRARMGKVNVDGETKSETFYPLFRSNTLVTFDFPRSKRGPMPN